VGERRLHSPPAPKQRQLQPQRNAGARPKAWHDLLFSRWQGTSIYAHAVPQHPYSAEGPYLQVRFLQIQVSALRSTVHNVPTVIHDCPRMTYTTYQFVFLQPHSFKPSIPQRWCTPKGRQCRQPRQSRSWLRMITPSETETGASSVELRLTQVQAARTREGRGCG
jgi:hypothetical protein